MTSPPSAKWPAYFIGPESHIHAIGVVAIAYNSLEVVFDLLIHKYMRTNKRIQAYVFSALNLHSQTELFKTSVGCNERRPEALDHIDHFIKCFGKCASNRNILMHADLNPEDTTDLVLALEKRSRNKPHIINKMSFKLEDIRNAADETYGTYMYGSGIYLKLRQMDAKGSDLGTPAGRERAWPKKPPLPTGLIPQTPSSDKRPQRQP